eukprot:s1316_g5.t1
MDRQVSAIPRKQDPTASRLRIAWTTGRKELLRDMPSGATDDADLEAPLPVDARRKQDEVFHQKHHIKLPLELTPASSFAPFPDVLAFLQAHQVLLNSWAMTATSDRLRAHPGPPDYAMQWAMDRDRQTRQAAVSLYAEGWPMRAGLQVAREQKTAVLWQIGPVGALADAHLPPAKRTCQ